MISKKSRFIALILCLPPFGWLGFHRFYAGRIGSAIFMMFTIGGFGWLTIVDLIDILLGDFKEENGLNIVLWFGKKWSLSYFVAWFIIFFFVINLYFENYFVEMLL